MSFRWWTFPALLLLSTLAVGIIAARVCRGNRVSDPAVARRAHRLPAEDSPARLQRRRQADRGVRRGAARGGRASADVPQPLHQRHPRGRGRALLPAQRRGLRRRGARRAVQFRLRRRAPGRQHHHHAGRAQLLPVQGKNDHPQVQRDAARVQDRGQPAPRTRSSSSTSTRSTSGSAPTGSRRRRRSISASGSPSSRSRSPPCWPGCPRRLRASTRSPIRSARKHAPAVRAAAHARAADDHRAEPARRRRSRSCMSSGRSTSSPCTPSISPRWCARPSTSATRRTPTRRACASTRRCSRRTRKRPTRRCAAACWTTTGATAIAAPRTMPICPPS